MISIILNVLRLILQPRTWSILENIPCTIEKNAYSVIIGWSILQMMLVLVSS